MIVQLLRFFTLFLLMLVTGAFWGPWFSLHRSLHVFNAEEFIRIVNILAKNMGATMRILMPSCIIFMLVSAALFPQKNSWQFYVNVSASALSIFSLIITLAVELPIVKSVQTWSEASIPAGWENIRNRWVKFHVLRMAASIASFACFAASVLIV